MPCPALFRCPTLTDVDPSFIRFWHYSYFNNAEGTHGRRPIFSSFGIQYSTCRFVNYINTCSKKWMLLSPDVLSVLLDLTVLRRALCRDIACSQQSKMLACLCLLEFEKCASNANLAKELTLMLNPHRSKLLKLTDDVRVRLIVLQLGLMFHFKRAHSGISPRFNES